MGKQTTATTEEEQWVMESPMQSWQNWHSPQLGVKPGDIWQSVLAKGKRSHSIFEDSLSGEVCSQKSQSRDKSPHICPSLSRLQSEARNKMKVAPTYMWKYCHRYYCRSQSLHLMPEEVQSQPWFTKTCYRVEWGCAATIWDGSSLRTYLKICVRLELFFHDLNFQLRAF